MSLLDLPPELFEHIIQEIVSVAGIQAAWQLRISPGTFASQISHEVLDKSSLATLSTADLASFTEKNLGRILYSRLKTYSDAAQPLLDKLEQMSDFLMQAVGSATISEQQDLLKRLCSAAAGFMGRHSVFVLLGALPPRFHGEFSKRLDALNAPLGLAQKAAAAIAIQDQDLVRSLVPGLLGTTEWYSDLFGSPVGFAISQSNADIVRIVLHCMIDSGLKKAKIPTTMASDCYSSASFDISAMHYAITTDRPEALEAIEDFRKVYQMRTTKTAFGDLLSLAIRLGQVRSVKIVLSMNVPSCEKEKADNLKRAAMSKNPHIMRAIMMSPGMGVDKVYADISPLVAAVRSADVHMVRAVLQAGADVNLRVGWAHEGKSPLEAALEPGREVVAQALLDSGAEIPPRDKWSRPLTLKGKKYKGVLQVLENELCHRNCSGLDERP
ncbi:hypothetical protein FB567DRAFT_447986 [Paraphoma chrysanthemicola]|uniref:Ankyrin n=1 Tax=Paraphoma chrysanthemicola TaxID=798071 RepID=A0A8K0VX21_9PLEO|nr:hypothetical protein FB567DRAFT_447986 [Paraphoma chrysanthemicola]